jgi:6-pyruvoyltetrahydropterin/6-carboxytetrahydropterin synthase
MHRFERGSWGRRVAITPYAGGMFQISVHAEFCAAHALVIGGQRETLHGHNWRVTAVVAGETLDNDGLLCDFHTLEDTLKQIIEPFQNANLNETPEFGRLNPSAENVARHIAERLHEALDEALAPHAAVERVSVTEAPGCVATFILK